MFWLSSFEVVISVQQELPFAGWICVGLDFQVALALGGWVRWLLRVLLLPPLLLLHAPASKIAVARSSGTNAQAAHHHPSVRMPNR